MAPSKRPPTLLHGQNSHRWPQFLPDGRRFLLFTLGRPDVRGVYLGSTADTTRATRIGSRVRLPVHAARVTCCSPGKARCGRERLSREFTLVEGELVPVAPKVLVHRGFFGYGAFSSSSTGSIAYRASAGETQLVWLDRTGRPVGTVGQPDDGQMSLCAACRGMGAPSLSRAPSPGTRTSGSSIRERGVPRRLTFGVNDNAADPSPDGSRVVHQAEGTT